MTTLAADTARTLELGNVNEFPVVASDIVYEGAAVGVVIASGHARPLTSVDQFVGFAESKVDNSAGAAAALNVRVLKKGAALLAVTGGVITDVGCPVYAQDDNAFSFIKTSGVFIGFARRYVSAGYMIVEFDVGSLVDPHEGLLAESVAANKTLDALDTGKVFFVTADSTAITLLAIEGVNFRVVNGGAYGAQIVTISPNAADAISGPDMTDTADKDVINTKTTANRGDYVDIEYGNADNWIVTKMKGTWAKEA